MRKILISRTDSIGDVILTLPFCAALKKKFPDDKLLFLAAPYTIPVLECCTAVDEIVNASELLKGSREEQIQKLKALEVDILVHVFPKKEVARLAKKAKIPRRIGTSHRGFHFLTCNERIDFTRKNSEFHEAQLNFHLGKNLGFENLPTWGELNDDLSYFQPKSKSTFRFLDSRNKMVILHPKSQGSAVEWPLTKYVELANLLKELGCKVFFTGTEKEGEAIRPFVQFDDDIVDTTGQFTLEELVSFIDESDFLVACSTGPLHIAGILNKNCIGLFTPQKPMHPGRWKPLGRNSQTITSKVNCSCKTKEKCSCLEEIEVNAVYNEIKKKLKL
jgi:heptosyltransferase III